MEVKEEREPRGGLMLGHGGDDGDMDLGVARVPQGVEPLNHSCFKCYFVEQMCQNLPSAPRRDDSEPGEADDGGEDDAGREGDGDEEEVLELALGEEALHVAQDGVGLEEGKHA